MTSAAWASVFIKWVMLLCMQDKIRQVFDNLIQLEHPNIVKFHKYWTDTKGEKPRVREGPLFLFFMLCMFR